MESERVLVIGGTGRTGARLVQRLHADPSFKVEVLARDCSKAQRVLNPSVFSGHSAVKLVEGDLLDLDPWAYRLDNIDVIVTTVSCGLRTDPLVLLGLRAPPANLPSAVDGDGVAQLARAAREHGVRRIVAVTTASAGTPWAPAAIFLNSLCFMSVKWKFVGEQAIRDSGLEYVIIRPFGLVETASGEESGLGVAFSQGKTEGTGRRIAREDVARLCHEAIRAPVKSSTFECWNSSGPPMDWGWLKPDGKVDDVNHDLAVTTTLLGLGGTAGLTAAGAVKVVRKALRFMRR